MKRVLCVGEALIDWISQENGLSLAEAEHFVKAPGGAPLNLSIGLARLGIPSGFAGALSLDAFGDALFAIMQSEGLDTQGVVRVAGYPTRMAYVTLDDRGDRQLAGFSEGAVADTQLVDIPLPEDLGCFCFGSLELKHPDPHKAILAAAKHSPLVAFDPNIRLTLWPDQTELATVLEEALKLADLVKLSEEELFWILGEGSIEPLGQQLFRKYDLSALAVTCGAAGVYYVTPQEQGWVKGFPVTCVDSTGAGDAFMAGWISEIIRRQLDKSKLRTQEQDWQTIFRVANGVGALAVARAGAISALPTRAQLDSFLHRTNSSISSSDK